MAMPDSTPSNVSREISVMKTETDLLKRKKKRKIDEKFSYLREIHLKTILFIQRQKIDPF